MDNLLNGNQLFLNYDDDSFLNDTNSYVNSFIVDNQLKDDNLLNDFDFSNFNQPNYADFQNYALLDTTLCDTPTNDVNQSSNLNPQQLNQSTIGTGQLDPLLNYEPTTNHSDHNFLHNLDCNEVPTETTANDLASELNADDELREFDDLDVQTLKNFFYSENVEDDDKFINDYLAGRDFDTLSIKDSLLLNDDLNDTTKLTSDSGCVPVSHPHNLKETKDAFSLNEYIRSESIGDFDFDFTSELNNVHHNQPQTQYSLQSVQTKKVYRCTLCKYNSVDKSKVNRHFLTHSGQKQYSCTHCRIKFNQPGSLKNHLASMHQTNEIEFRCSLCNAFSTLNLGELNRHQRNEHNLFKTETQPAKEVEGYSQINNQQYNVMNKENKSLNYQIANHLTPKMNGLMTSNHTMSVSPMNMMTNHMNAVNNSMLNNRIMSSNLIMTNEMNEEMKFRTNHYTNNSRNVPNHKKSSYERMNYRNLFDFMY